MHLQARIRSCAMITTLLSVGAASAGAPTSNEAEAATYTGIHATPISLANGLWRGEPYDPDGVTAPRAGLVDGFRLTGDLNDDGDDEAVVMLWFSGGGTGTFSYVAVLGRRNGEVEQLAIATIGDRVQVRGARIEGSRIAIDTIESGPDDDACCPGQSFHRTWEFADGNLPELARENRGRASLALAAESEWLLDEFAADALVPASVEVTLNIDGDRITGSSGCNRYSAAVADVEGPRSLRVGPAVATTRTCQGEAADVERRFLEALAHVERFSFTTGRLALMWSHDDQFGRLVFSQRAAAR